MRKKIAQWLYRTAVQLDQSLSEPYKARKLGLAYHITQKDVSKCAKEHGLSLRKATDYMIRQTKSEIFHSIIKTIHSDNIIEYDVRKGLFNADVSGHINIYIKDDSSNAQSEEKICRS